MKCIVCGNNVPKDRENGVEMMRRFRAERDAAIGFILLLAWQGAITMDRATEGLKMSMSDIRKEAHRLFDEKNES